MQPKVAFHSTVQASNWRIHHVSGSRCCWLHIKPLLVPSANDPPFVCWPSCDNFRFWVTMKYYIVTIIVILWFMPHALRVTIKLLQIEEFHCITMQLQDSILCKFTYNTWGSNCSCRYSSTVVIAVNANFYQSLNCKGNRAHVALGWTFKGSSEAYGWLFGPG